MCVCVHAPARLSWRATWRAGDDSLELCDGGEMGQPHECQVAAHVGSGQVCNVCLYVCLCVCWKPAETFLV